MLNLPGYSIKEEILAGIHTTVYKGYDRQKQRPVIIKTCNSKYPSLEELDRLRYEYTILQTLDIDGVIKAYNLEKDENGLALILEDFGGCSLKEALLNSTFSLEKCLQIAIELTDILDRLHAVPIIHKDIKPSNILINLETGTVKLADFSIASRLSSDTTHLNNITLIEGTFTYVSPEQTGKMNRLIDYRTDFYSFGVTLYEMLTGQVPFTNTKPLEIIYCHLAKSPVSPDRLNPNLPETVVAIVMKLLAKNAEDRYQSAAGLKTDLEKCLWQLQTTGNIDCFSIADSDRASQLLISEKLYGREAEVQALTTAFERVCQGATELLLVSGDSGIGKTSIINELYKPVIKTKGYFIVGKFHEFDQNIPYHAFIQAFSSLINRLLAESPQRVALWQKKLETALGSSAELICHFIPRLEKIIGSQPNSTVINTGELEHQLFRAFQKFIHVFSKSGHPIVLFLDHLQWADSASLKLLYSLTTQQYVFDEEKKINNDNTADKEYLLIVGAYRDNQLSQADSFRQTLQKIEQDRAIVNHITIENLNQENVRQLLADTITDVDRVDRTKSLADLLFQKTKGNPFFLNQLLKTLYAENLLTYEFSSGKWQWEIKKVQTFALSDLTIVELISKNLDSFSPPTQKILQLAACLGNQFSLDDLAIVSKQSPLITGNQLWEALKAGFIVPFGKHYPLSSFDRTADEYNSCDLIFTDYKFLHDQVRQVSYSWISESERIAIHVQIGKLLLQNTPQEQLAKNIFNLVNQLNFGVDSITDRSEKETLAKLNLIAGKTAKASAAYHTALKYLEIGLDCLEDDSWHENYELTFSLYLASIEAKYLNSYFDAAIDRAHFALEKTIGVVDLLKINELLIQIYLSQNNFSTALERGIQLLSSLGISLDHEISNELDTEIFLDLPLMIDLKKQIIVRILIAMNNPAYIGAPQLFTKIVYTLISFCLKHGNSADTCYGYLLYAILLCKSVDTLNLAYQFGQLGLNLLEQFDRQDIKLKVICDFNGHIRHWREHLKFSLEPLQSTYQVGLDLGDYLYSGYAALSFCSHSFFIGENLEIVANKHLQYLNILHKLQLDYHIVYAQIGQQLILDLLDRSRQENQLVGEAFNEDEAVSILIETQNFTSLFYFYTAKTILLVFLKEHKLAIDYAHEAIQYQSAVTGLITNAIHNFYYSLALLGAYSSSNAELKQEYLRIVNDNQAIMKKWAENAPMNYQHKYDLIEAEKARVLNQYWQASELYDRSIQGAKEQGYIQEEALANELAGEFYLACNKPKVAKVYLADAYYGYLNWGAATKVKDLEQKYTHLLYSVDRSKPNSSLQTQEITVPLNFAQNIDLESICQAFQAISQEIVLDKLLDKLMKIVLENTGAQKGFLILDEQDVLSVVIAASLVRDKIIISRNTIPVELSQQLPISVINYVSLTQESVLSNQTNLNEDVYFQKYSVRSFVCAPIVKRKQLVGMIYLENNLTIDAFNSQRLEIIKLLCTQAAISLQNAKLYQNLQQAQSIKKAAHQMRQALEREKELNELKNNFICMTSHEFRTPLTTIQSSSELLKHYSHKWDEEKKLIHFQRIENSVANMINLLEDLLLVNKAEAGKVDFSPQPLNPIEFCQNLAEEMQLGTDSLQHKIIFSSLGQCFSANLDEKLLRHILSNLLSNAIKYSPNGGNIDFRAICDRDTITFEVQDRGIGIPQKDQEKLFEMFHRANNVGKIPGTGLGLAIVKKFVDLHGGQMKVKSEAHIGTTFTIIIPVV